MDVNLERPLTLQEGIAYLLLRDTSMLNDTQISTILSISFSILEALESHIFDVVPVEFARSSVMSHKMMLGDLRELIELYKSRFPSDCLLQMLEKETYAEAVRAGAMIYVQCREHNLPMPYCPQYEYSLNIALKRGVLCQDARIVQEAKITTINQGSSGNSVSQSPVEDCPAWDVLDGFTFVILHEALNWSYHDTSEAIALDQARLRNLPNLVFPSKSIVHKRIEMVTQVMNIEMIRSVVDKFIRLTPNGQSVIVAMIRDHGQGARRAGAMIYHKVIFRQHSRLRSRFAASTACIPVVENHFKKHDFGNHEHSEYTQVARAEITDIKPRQEAKDWDVYKAIAYYIMLKYHRLAICDIAKILNTVESSIDEDELLFATFTTSAQDVSAIAIRTEPLTLEPLTLNDIKWLVKRFCGIPPIEGQLEKVRDSSTILQSAAIVYKDTIGSLRQRQNIDLQHSSLRNSRSMSAVVFDEPDQCWKEHTCLHKLNAAIASTDGRVTASSIPDKDHPLTFKIHSWQQGVRGSDVLNSAWSAKGGNTNDKLDGTLIIDLTSECDPIKLDYSKHAASKQNGSTPMSPLFTDSGSDDEGSQQYINSQNMRAEAILLYVDSNDSGDSSRKRRKTESVMQEAHVQLEELRAAEEVSVKSQEAKIGELSTGAPVLQISNGIPDVLAREASTPTFDVISNTIVKAQKAQERDHDQPLATTSESNFTTIGITPPCPGKCRFCFTDYRKAALKNHERYVCPLNPYVEQNRQYRKSQRESREAMWRKADSKKLTETKPAVVKQKSPSITEPTTKLVASGNPTNILRISGSSKSKADHVLRKESTAGDLRACRYCSGPFTQLKWSYHEKFECQNNPAALKNRRNAVVLPDPVPLGNRDQQKTAQHVMFTNRKRHGASSLSNVLFEQTATHDLTRVDQCSLPDSTEVSYLSGASSHSPQNNSVPQNNCHLKNEENLIDRSCAQQTSRPSYLLEKHWLMLSKLLDQSSTNQTKITLLEKYVKRIANTGITSSTQSQVFIEILLAHLEDSVVLSPALGPTAPEGGYEEGASELTRLQRKVIQMYIDALRGDVEEIEYLLGLSCPLVERFLLLM